MLRFKILCIVLSWGSLSIAQFDNIEFDRIREKDGLIHEQVLSVCKDSKGYLWIGTSGGIERFDGYKHKKYTISMVPSRGILNNYFFSIYEDSKKQLWFCTKGGLCQYHWENDTFTFITNDPDNPYSLSHNNVREITEDKDGSFWIASYGGGLIHYIPGLNRFYSYKHNPEDIFSIPSDRVNTVLLDSKGRIWVGTERGGMARFDRNNNKFYVHHLFNHPDSLQSNTIITIVEDKQGLIWIGTCGGGLSKYNPNTNKFKTFNNIPGNDNSLSNNDVMVIYQTMDNMFYLGTYGGGLSIFDPISEKFTTYKNDPFDNTSLIYNLIWSIYEDDLGIIWLGSFGSGLCKYDPKDHKFKHYRTRRDPVQSKLMNNISVLYFDHRGILWVGSPTEGLESVNLETGIINRYQTKPNDPTTSVRSVYEDSENTLWVGTNEGIVVYDQNRKKIKYYCNERSKDFTISRNAIYTIEEDIHGNMWFGTWNDGLYMLPRTEQIKNPIKARFTVFSNSVTDSTSLSSDIVYVVHSDKDGGLWIGTDVCLNKFDYLTKSFKRYPIPNVSTIWEESSGILWIGSFENGIYRFDKKNSEIKNFTERDGLKTNIIHGILGDTNNVLWISTQNGLMRFDYAMDSITTFDESDGLQANKFNFNAYASGPGGQLFFGGNNGFNAFYPDEISKDTSQPRVVLTDFKVLSQKTNNNSKDQKDVYISKKWFDRDTILLSNTENFFSIEFAALQYSGSQKVQYRYKLNKFDNDWHYTSALQRVANYTNVDPGTYQFIVEATNRDGRWSNDRVSIYIVISPTWYQTIWFEVIVLLILLLLIFFLNSLRIKRITKRNFHLQQTIDKNMRELEEINAILLQQTEQLKRQKKDVVEYNRKLKAVNATKDKLFSIIAHDLRSPFQSILGFINLLHEDKDIESEEQKKLFIYHIYKSSNELFYLLENLLQWSRSQSGVLKINREPIEYNELVNDTLIVLRDVAIDKNISIEVEPGLGKIELYGDRSMLQTVIRNLVSNAIKFTHRDGKITISISMENGYAITCVTDNGIGMNKISADKLFDNDEKIILSGTNNEKGTGLGLILCKEFVEKHGGDISVESSPGEGCIFKFTIPLV